MDNQILVLDTSMARNKDECIQSPTYRKKTSTGQYRNFHSIVFSRRKRGLIKCLVSRATKIYSTETLQNELNITSVLRSNDYTEKFFKNNINDGKAEMFTAERKGLFICLPLKRWLFIRNSH